MWSVGEAAAVATPRQCPTCGWTGTTGDLEDGSCPVCTTDLGS